MDKIDNRFQSWVFAGLEAWKTTSSYILEIKGWQFGEPPYGEDEFGSIYWLMEDDGTPKGQFIRELTRKEAEEIRSAKGGEKGI